MLRGLGWVWSLPVTIAAAVLIFPWCGIERIRWTGRAFSVQCKRGLFIREGWSQTWGVWIFSIGAETASAVFELAEQHSRHEHRHVDQWLAFGVLMIPLWALEYPIRFAFASGPDWPERLRKWPRYMRAYWLISWEKDARRAAGQPVELADLE